MHGETQPMVTLGIRVDLVDFIRLRELAQQRGMVTQQGKPVLSLAAREVIRAGLDVAEREAVTDERQE